jgi:hypothetical protein
MVVTSRDAIPVADLSVEDAKTHESDQGVSTSPGAVPEFVRHRSF